MVLCFSPMVKLSGLNKFETKEEKLIEHQFPYSAESLTWEEFENDMFYQYDKDFTISITMKKDKTKQVDSTPAMSETIIDLKEGSNSGNDQTKMNITLEKLRTFESGLCYKILSDVETFDKMKYFSLHLKEHLKTESATGKVTGLKIKPITSNSMCLSGELYITSMENANGIVPFNWKNGMELKLSLDNKYNSFKLRAIQYSYLKLKTGCTDDQSDVCVTDNIIERTKSKLEEYKTFELQGCNDFCIPGNKLYIFQFTELMINII